MLDSKLSEETKDTNATKQPNGSAGNGKSLSQILAQKPLIKDADTETLGDKAEASNESFDVTFNRAVKGISNYSPAVATATGGAD